MAQGEVNEVDEIIVIGGSAGSLEVLLQLLPQLKSDFNIPIVIVLHRRQGGDSPLVELLSTKTKIKVKEAEEKEIIESGSIYIVPADYHLLFEKDGSFSLGASEKVNYSRPSIDVVFSAAADVYASSVIGILLSGANADGTKGFEDIKENGGVTIAQKPETAEISYMPENAINNDVVDMVLTTDEIAAYLNEL